MLFAGNKYLMLKRITVHDESVKAAIAAFHEKDEEDHGEESATITLARCLKNSEKIK
jgi:hypothetical protein